jgi:hypothetical protein
VIEETISAVEIENDIFKVLQSLRQIQYLLHQLIHGPIMSVMQPSNSNDQFKEASSSDASSPPLPANWQSDSNLDSLVRLLSDDTQHSSLTEMFSDVPPFLHGSPSPQLPGEVSTVCFFFLPIAVVHPFNAVFVFQIFSDFQVPLNILICHILIRLSNVHTNTLPEMLLMIPTLFFPYERGFTLESI